MSLSRIFLSMLILSISILTCVAGGCTKKSKTSKSNSMEQTIRLNGDWYHSYEDEKEGEAIKCYRPSTYSFPPSRGRSGIRFEQGGKFTELNIAPNDAGHVETKGTFQLDEGTKILNISLDKDRKMKWEIISLSGGLLKIKEI